MFTILPDIAEIFWNFWGFIENNFNFNFIYSFIELAFVCPICEDLEEYFQGLGTQGHWILEPCLRLSFCEHAKKPFSVMASSREKHRNERVNTCA